MFLFLAATPPVKYVAPPVEARHSDVMGFVSLAMIGLILLTFLVADLPHLIHDCKAKQGSPGEYRKMNLPGAARIRKVFR